MIILPDEHNLGVAEADPAVQENARPCAAAYVRMSTEHQQYSTANQLDEIQAYAGRRGWPLVKVYSDEGRSGLTIQGRAALSEMIGDVLTKKVNFAHILVYDVSRWGRFQDPDEAAHYEFICREAGVAVHYCAEQFDNDGTLTSTIAKSFKRAMAGEYSRELSVKVFQGASRLIHLGFKQGGSAVYGLRRLLVDQTGQPKGTLKRGEQKNLQTDRVVLIPGPEAEIEVVRWIFEAFVNCRRSAAEIMRQLNARGIAAESGRAWSAGQIRALLQNENYIGNLVYYRTSFKLGSARMVNPPEKWVRKDNAFTGIVAPELFFKARDIFEVNRKKYHLTNEYLLACLRALFIEQGRLSSELMKKLKQSPDPKTFQARFGSVVAAYKLVGYSPRQDYRHFEISRHLSKINRELITAMVQRIENLGATAAWCARSQVLQINGELRVGVIFARHCVTNFGSSRWVLRWDAKRWEPTVKPDLTMAVRMDRHNQGIQDYYLLPGRQYTRKKLRLAERNGAHLDGYRFPNLDFLLGMAARVKFS